MNVITTARRMPRQIENCRDHRHLPSFARLGRARAPVPTRTFPTRAWLIAARNRYAICLIPSRVFSSYDCRRAIAAVFLPERDDSPVALCCGAYGHWIAIGNFERAQAVAC